MFNRYTLKELREIIKLTRTYHNIKGYSKMKKAELIESLKKHFIIKKNILHLRQHKEKELNHKYEKILKVEEKPDGINKYFEKV